MKALDRFLQRWRIAKSKPYLPPGSRVLDIGSADGALADQVPGLAAYTGLDPTIPATRTDGHKTLVRGHFPDAVPAGETFDAIVMLAVLEHLPESVLPELAPAFARLLRPGGHVIVTVPAPLVDEILKVLLMLRLIDGMAVEEHHHFDPAETPSILRHPQLALVRAERFQLGLNNLFVFRRV